MIIADTSVWIDFFRGIDAPHTIALESVIGNDELFIGDLIIAELFQGAGNEKIVNQIQDVVRRLTCVNMVNESLAYKSAANYRYLRSNGITIRKTIDMLIATFCIEAGAKLIHNDRDFDPIEEYLGLKILK